MFGIDRTGIRFVLTNFESGKEAEAGSWYDSYTGQILFESLLVNAYRFENPNAASTDEDPRYAALYDFVAEDLKSAWPATDHHGNYPHHMFDDARWKLVSVPVRATLALAAEGGTAVGDLTGVTLVLNDSPVDEARTSWTTAAMATGLFTSWARFDLVDGEPNPHASLEVFETTDADPATVLERVSRQVGSPPAVEGARHYAGSFRLLSRATTPRGDLGHLRGQGA